MRSTAHPMAGTTNPTVTRPTPAMTCRRVHYRCEVEHQHRDCRNGRTLVVVDQRVGDLQADRRDDECPPEPHDERRRPICRRRSAVAVQTHGSSWACRWCRERRYRVMAFQKMTTTTTPHASSTSATAAATQGVTTTRHHTDHRDVLDQAHDDVADRFGRGVDAPLACPPSPGGTPVRSPPPCATRTACCNVVASPEISRAMPLPRRAGRGVDRVPCGVEVGDLVDDEVDDRQHRGRHEHVGAGQRVGDADVGEPSRETREQHHQVRVDAARPAALKTRGAARRHHAARPSPSKVPPTPRRRTGRTAPRTYQPVCGSLDRRRGRRLVREVSMAAWSRQTLNVPCSPTGASPMPSDHRIPGGGERDATAARRARTSGTAGTDSSARDRRDRTVPPSCVDRAEGVATG